MSNIPPEGRPLTVTLTVEQWQIVMGAMHEVSMPYRVSGPLVAQMLHQLHATQVAANVDPPQRSDDVS